MIPFMNKRKAVAAIAAKMKGGKVEDMPEEDMAPESDGLMEAAMDLIGAVHAKDAKGASMALEAAFTILESKPHEEFEEEME